MTPKQRVRNVRRKTRLVPNLPPKWKQLYTFGELNKGTPTGRERRKKIADRIRKERKNVQR